MASDNSFILRGGRIIDPANQRDEITDLTVVNGVIADPAEWSGDKISDLPVLDVSGLTVCPGLIDMHVHLREPGCLEAEDIRSGTMAAARGGFTTIVAMPNTDPPLDSISGMDDFRHRCRTKAAVRVLTCPSLSVKQQGKELTDIPALKEAGAAALSEDGRTLADNRLMREAMLNARNCGLVILDHCEDSNLAADGALHAGEIAARLGVAGKPRSSEDVIVARDIALAADTGCRVHIQHVSSAFSAALVRWAKDRSLPVSAEVTPHHLLLTEEAVPKLGGNGKMNPPLREERDRRALLDGLADDSIDAIATDHAPHTWETKNKPLAEAANGVIGLETALAVCLTELHRRQNFSLLQILAKFTSGPRNVLGLERGGALTPGSPADITLIDPQQHWTIDAESMVSKARNTPFAGMQCQGMVKTVFLGGIKVYSSRQPL